MVKKEDVSDELAAEVKHYWEVKGLGVRDVSEIMDLSMQDVTKIINSEAYKEVDIDSVDREEEVSDAGSQKISEGKILDQVSKWFSEFSETEHFEKLSEEQKKHSGFIIHNFTEFMYSYYGLEPDEWHKGGPGGGLEKCCTQLFPRKVTADESLFKSIAPVLATFFSFAGDRGFVEEPQRLVERVQKIDEEIVEKASDSKNWGLGKSVMMEAKRAGVDIQDEQELNEFFNSLGIQTGDSSEEKNQR